MTAPRPVVEALVVLVADISNTGPGDLSPDASLAALGLGSLAAVELSVRIVADLGIETGDDELHALDRLDLIAGN